mmetsp:Transcript_81767/g.198154  ORF Transcript_81767/g.198154 Transcript_81767/m.198154 type:complete len:414 (+) Transcript_81767:815-2056(+)
MRARLGHEVRPRQVHHWQARRHARGGAPRRAATLGAPLAGRTIVGGSAGDPLPFCPPAAAATDEAKELPRPGAGLGADGLLRVRSWHVQDDALDLPQAHWPHAHEVAHAVVEAVELALRPRRAEQQPAVQQEAVVDVEPERQQLLLLPAPEAHRLELASGVDESCELIGAWLLAEGQRPLEQPLAEAGGWRSDVGEDPAVVEHQAKFLPPAPRPCGVHEQRRDVGGQGLTRGHPRWHPRRHCLSGRASRRLNVQLDPAIIIPWDCRRRWNGGGACSGVGFYCSNPLFTLLLLGAAERENAERGVHVPQVEAPKPECLRAFYRQDLADQKPDTRDRAIVRCEATDDAVGRESQELFAQPPLEVDCAHQSLADCVLPAFPGVREGEATRGGADADEEARRQHGPSALPACPHLPG